MGTYSILAKDYEFLNPKEAVFGQRAFFKTLIDKHRVENCLDCACGVGWHLVMLDELGLECFGSDLSPDMLAIAKTKTQSEPIALKEGDFRNLGDIWDRKFDMIICMSNSIRHMLSAGDVTAALNSMYDQLSPGGLLVIDNGLSDRLINAKPKLLPGRVLNDQAFYFILEYPNPDQIVFNILHVKKTDESFSHSFESMPLSAMRKRDYEQCLDATGLVKVSYFGDFDFSEYDEQESNRLIIIARKR